MINVARIFKAQPVSGPIADFLIEGILELPQGDSESSKEYFRRDAQKIIDILSRSLPGGTLDQLLFQLLERKLTLLRVTS